MVIAKCLRSPQQGSVEMAASAGTTVPQLFPLIAMKLKFNNLGGLFRRRHKLPFLHGVLASLNQQEVSPDDPGAFHTSLGRDDDFDLDFSVNIQSFCEAAIQVRPLTLAHAHLSIQQNIVCKPSSNRNNQPRGNGPRTLLQPASS